MEIKVSVENVDLTSSIGELAEYDAENDYMGRRKPYTLGEAVAGQIVAELKKTESYRTLAQSVLDLKQEEIREQIKPVVAAAIEASVQPTNRFGQPTGEPVSMTEVIVKEAKELLSKRSDYGRGPMYVEKLIAESVDRAIKKELAEVIAEEKAKVVAAVRAKAAELIATAVKEGVGR